MNKKEQEAFEAVRKEDVVLWIGSGVSKYAGYPTGKELSKIIYDKLPASEKKGINKNDLSDVCQAFRYTGENGREELLAILQKQLVDRAPLSSEYHKKLSQIYHIKTIITTNYDTLIEDAYQEKGQVIVTDAHVAGISKNKTQIFKIHGDLSEKESVVITRSDYTNDIVKKSDSIISAVLSERIATKTHIFLGYSLEDQNVNVLLEKIWSKIQDRKTCYFIAPGTTPAKIKALKALKIKYIDSTAEAFISALYKDCYDNLIDDFNKGKISTDTIQKSFQANNLKPNITGEKDGYVLTGLQGTNGHFKATMNLIFNDKEFAKKFAAFSHGESLDDLVIPADKLTDFLLKAGDIPIWKREGLVELKLINRPNITGTFDVRFIETGYERKNLTFKAFFSPSKNCCIIDFTRGSLIIDITENKQDQSLTLKFRTEHKNEFGSVSDEIDFSEFFYHFSGGHTVQIDFKNEHRIKKKLQLYPDMHAAAKMNLAYFKNLRLVEDHFDVHFESIPYINDDTEFALTRIVKAINHEIFEHPFEDSLKLTFKNINKKIVSQLDDYNRLNLPENRLTVVRKEREIVSLYGHEFDLGYRKTQFPALELINKSALLTRKTRRAELKSREKKMYVSYVNTFEESA